MLASGSAKTIEGAGGVLLREAGGDIAFGWVLGYVAFRLLRSIGWCSLAWRSCSFRSRGRFWLHESLPSG